MTPPIYCRDRVRPPGFVVSERFGISMVPKRHIYRKEEVLYLAGSSKCQIFIVYPL